MLLKLDGTGPVSNRLYSALKRAIASGTLHAGAKVPSTRTLARDLGVSRKVVTRAFDRLVTEGYFETRSGAGTFVSADAAADLTPSLRRRHAPPETARVLHHLSQYARRVLAQSPWPPPGSRSPGSLKFDFHYGTPALLDFPHATWARLIGSRVRRLSIGDVRYGRTLGYLPLRRAIAQHLRRFRGVSTTDDQVIVVNGSQHALDLLVRLLVNPGDSVVIEEPGYQGARQPLIAANARVIPVPVDDRGLDVSQLPRGRPVRLAYVTPSHQFPLGGVLPVERRLELLRWAEETDACVIEDDYDSEFQYHGAPVEAIQGLDRAGRVLYVGTVSKVLFPSIRIGYLVVPEALVPPLASLRILADYHTPTFQQAALADFIARGHFESHLRRARVRNARKRAALLAALQKHLGSRAEVVGENAGVHVVVWLPELPSSRVQELCQEAARAGLGIYGVAPYYLRPPDRAGLLLGYASLHEREMDEAIGSLRQVVDRIRRR